MSKEILLLTDDPSVFYGSYGAFEDAYKAYCVEYDEEWIDDNKWQWFTDEMDSEIDFFWDKVKTLDVQAERFLLVGTAGTWRGRMSGGMIDRDLKTLIEKSVNNMDNITIKLVNGAIEIEACHHDGTNTWTIYALNSRAEKTMDKWEEQLSERDLHDKLNKGFYHTKFKL